MNTDMKGVFTAETRRRGEKNLLPRINAEERGSGEGQNLPPIDTDDTDLKDCQNLKTKIFETRRKGGNGGKQLQPDCQKSPELPKTTEIENQSRSAGAARRSPPRHAKRASWTPGLRRKERIYRWHL